MSGRKDLKSLIDKHKTVDLDSMCFIYLLNRVSEFNSLCIKLFEILAKKQLVTSVITLVEILSKEEVVKDKRLYQIHRASLYERKNLKIIQADNVLAEKAAHLRVEYDLALPDAIQLASANLEKATLFVTNDERFRRVKKPEILILADYI